VVEFPVKTEGKNLNEVSIWEQVSLAVFLQKYWSDNQVSCTVTFKPDEKEDIETILNYYKYELKSISFLPKLEKGVYAQMPYEAITKEQYDQKVKNIRPIIFSSISEDTTAEKFCNNDVCTI
jgi:hypothetical protein